MGARTSGREAALQMLFAAEAASHSAAEVTTHFWREMPGDVEGRAYANPLVQDTWLHREEIDDKIQQASSNWRLERMSPVDRNILRLGTGELMLRPDVPVEVILDEAVELAKRYGADRSSQFVNGVLDELAKRLRPT